MSNVWFYGTQRYVREKSKVSQMHGHEELTYLLGLFSPGAEVVSQAARNF